MGEWGLSAEEQGPNGIVVKILEIKVNNDGLYMKIMGDDKIRHVDCHYYYVLPRTRLLLVLM